MRNATTVVRDAIANTPQDYLEKTCTMRSDGVGRVGSYFPGFTPAGVLAMLGELEWAPYTHPAIQGPAQGFIAQGVPGRMGMVHIEDVPAGTLLRLEDPKDTDGTPCGGCEAVWENSGHSGHPVEHVVALVGPDEGKEVLWTFFPGDPIKPSMVKRRQPCSHCGGEGREMDGERGPCMRCDGSKEEDLHGAAVSRERAQALGVEWVKLE